MKKILVVNPGSTSSEVSFFCDGEEKYNWTIKVEKEVQEKIENLHQLDEYFFEKIENLLIENDESYENLDAYVGRGAPLRPVQSGTYSINQKMIDDVKSGDFIEHASQLGALIGWKIKEKYGKPIFIVDPVSVDEMEPIARISGLPECERRKVFHMH